MFETLHADLQRSILVNRQAEGGARAFWSQFLHVGVQAVIIYRYGRWALRMPPVVRHLLLLLYFPLKFLYNVFPGINIPTSAEIGPGLVIHTWNGVYVPACRIGRNAYFQHGVVVNYFCQEIGDDVYFGPGCKVARPIRIGSRVRIGANAVVLQDIPDDHTAVGIPAKLIPNKETVVGTSERQLTDPAMNLYQSKT